MKHICLLLLFALLPVRALALEPDEETQNGRSLKPAEDGVVCVVGDGVWPSVIPFKAGTTMGGAIREAGGGGLGRKSRKVSIWRRGPGEGENERIALDLRELEKGAAKDVELRAYDIIEVSRRKRGTVTVPRGTPVYPPCNFSLRGQM